MQWAKSLGTWHFTLPSPVPLHTSWSCRASENVMWITGLPWYYPGGKEAQTAPRLDAIWFLCLHHPKHKVRWYRHPTCWAYEHKVLWKIILQSYIQCFKNLGGQGYFSPSFIVPFYYYQCNGYHLLNAYSRPDSCYPMYSLSNLQKNVLSICETGTLLSSPLYRGENWVSE